MLIRKISTVKQYDSYPQPPTMGPEDSAQIVNIILKELMCMQITLINVSPPLSFPPFRFKSPPHKINGLHFLLPQRFLGKTQMTM